jgi:hypothetical protein
MSLEILNYVAISTKWQNVFIVDSKCLASLLKMSMRAAGYIPAADWASITHGCAEGANLGCKINR